MMIFSFLTKRTTIDDEETDQVNGLLPSLHLVIVSATLFHM